MGDFTQEEMLAIFSPAETGALDKSGGLTDVWGTITGFEVKVSDFDGRTQHQLEMHFITDTLESGKQVEQREWFKLPTDSKTGELKIDPKTQKLARPHVNSAWGRFEIMVNNLGIPWGGGLNNLIGIHAHFQYKEFDKGKEVTELDDGEKSQYVTKARFIVEWDEYDNRVREANGFAPITITSAQVSAPEVPVSASGDPEKDALEVLLATGTLIKYVGEIQRKHKHLMSFATRPVVEKWEADGMIEGEKTAQGVVYTKGKAYS